MTPYSVIDLVNNISYNGELPDGTKSLPEQRSWRSSKAAFTRDATGSATAVRQRAFTRRHAPRSRRATAASPGGILSLNLKLSRALFFLKNTDLRNCRYMDYMQESRATAACHVKRYCHTASRAAACRAPVALPVVSRVNVPEGVLLVAFSWDQFNKTCTRT